MSSLSIAGISTRVDAPLRTIPKCMTTHTLLSNAFESLKATEDSRQTHISLTVQWLSHRSAGTESVWDTTHSSYA